MSYMDKFMSKAQEMRAKAESMGQQFRAKMPFQTKGRLMQGPKITLSTIKNRQVRNVVKAKIPALQGYDAIAGRRGLRNVPKLGLRAKLKPLEGPQLGPPTSSPRYAPPVVDDREPRPTNIHNISVEL